MIKVEKPFVQKLFEPVNEAGQSRTLKDLLQFVFGDEFKNCKTETICYFIEMRTRF
jgi:hypothetical protein